ncbi:putative PD-(D/E)XK family protein DUF4420 [Nocardioides sp. J9]|uniref:PD-(D/E)XK motif protein n=1 Tax=Nocardioides sp. J9 TaxID=935844 RepID=UPI0011A36247|nr:PD-(D/E)XK motif protein [Nocardioides sp. J9]TWG93053.1 putative PD-(D/E)XK family protein DUF4420 [Nocardioides sp. J9]
MSGTAALLWAGITAQSSNWLMKPVGVTVEGAEVGVARDPHGRPVLLVPATGRAAGLKVLTRGLSARVGALASGATYADWLMVTCEDRSLRSTFFSLCDDVIRALSNLAEESDPVAEALAVVSKWKALLEGVHGGVLSETQCSGLLAELHAMEQLAERYGPDAALAAWAGPDRSRVDFRFDKAGVEVKATLQRDQFRVTVHGLWQLDELEVGSLRLFAQQMELVPTGGDSIPDAVARLVALGIDEAALQSELAKVGCLPVDQDVYRTIRFKVLDECGVVVGSATPRIVRSSFSDPDVQAAISGVTYQVDLTSLSQAAGRLDNPLDVFEGLDA